MRPAMEDRRDEEDVVDLAGADPGIGGDQAVARLQGLGREGGQKIVQGLRHAAEKCRQPVPALRDHLALRVEQGATEVPGFGDDAREGGAQQRDLRLVDDGEQLVPPHGERGGVERRRIVCTASRYPFSVITSMRRSSTSTRAPGGTTVVDS